MLVILKKNEMESRLFIVYLWILRVVNAVQTHFYVNKYADLLRICTVHEQTIAENRKSGTGYSIRTLAQLLQYKTLVLHCAI